MSGNLSVYLGLGLALLALATLAAAQYFFDIASYFETARIEGWLAGTGAVASFVTARLLGRKILERFLSGHINFCDRCSNRLLTKIVLVSRLMPFVSFDIVSYGAGLTKIGIRHFTAATFIGMLPCTFVYNYFGAVLVINRWTALAIGLLMVLLFFLFRAGLSAMTCCPCAGISSMSLSRIVAGAVISLQVRV